MGIDIVEDVRCHCKCNCMIPTYSDSCSYCDENHKKLGGGD